MTQDWDAIYRAGDLDHLRKLKETPRFGVIAGYLHRLLPRFKLLDLGCGEGLLWPYLDQSRVTGYVGVDVAASAVAKAQSLIGPSGVESRLLCNSIERFLPETTDRFDAILFNEVLFFVEDPVAQIARYRPWLAEGGVILVSQYRSPKPEGGARRLTAELYAALETPPWTTIAGASVTHLGHEGKELTWDIRVVQ